MPRALKQAFTMAGVSSSNCQGYVSASETGFGMQEDTWVDSFVIVFCHCLRLAISTMGQSPNNQIRG